MLLVEFVTGGGLLGNPLPRSLLAEGLMMRDALARDLSELPDIELATVFEPRVPPACVGISRRIADDEDPWDVWAKMAAEADIAWVVAPETGGALRRLVALCRAAGAKVIGPDDDAIRIASSRRLTAEALAKAGVRTPQTWRPDAIPAHRSGPFVSKPDDGAGCEATLFWAAAPPAGAVPPDHVVQAYASGDAASLTVLKAGGRVDVLAANRQHMTVTDGAFAFDGLTVGALDHNDPEISALAKSVALALPGLDGLFGIDLVMTPDGPLTIEINPRLTTAYAGLRGALGINPLTLLTDFMNDAPARRPGGPVRPIEIRP